MAHRKLPEQLRATGYTIDSTDDGMIAEKTRGSQPRWLEFTLAVDDGIEISDEADVVIAGAVLDLVDLPTAVENIRGLLVDEGLYAPATFNGHTWFMPREPLDGRIERLYHRHMDEIRDQPGSSRVGQQLLNVLPAAGYTVLSAGGGDSIVRPVDGAYSAAESTMLAHLLSIIDGALADYPPDVLDPQKCEAWIETRREQVDRGELTLVAHHLDVLARL